MVIPIGMIVIKVEILLDPFLPDDCQRCLSTNRNPTMWLISLDNGANDIRPAPLRSPNRLLARLKYGGLFAPLPPWIL